METYVARIAEEIAQAISADQVRVHSPSFSRFELAIRNGPKLEYGEQGKTH